jgi:hypothetical protein
MRIAIAAGMLGLLAATALGAEEPRVAEACAADHARLCSEASINSEGATRCLRSHFEELSKPCRDALNARRQRVLDRVRKACANEIAAFCTREPVGAPVRCLRHHESQLSSGCKAALPRWSS